MSSTMSCVALAFGGDGYAGFVVGIPQPTARWEETPLAGPWGRSNADDSAALPLCGFPRKRRSYIIILKV